jgi:hypothetical protein
MAHGDAVGSNLQRRVTPVLVGPASLASRCRRRGSSSGSTRSATPPALPSSGTRGLKAVGRVQSKADQGRQADYPVRVWRITRHPPYDRPRKWLARVLEV